MRRRARTEASAVVALVTTVLLLAAPAVAQEESPDAGGERLFRIGLTNDIDSMNPFNAYESPAYETFFLQYDLLVNFGEDDLAPAPGLAESWEVSDDGLTWTFNVRETTWHDGEPFTAEDVAFTFDRIINDPQAFFAGYVDGIEEVTAEGDQVIFRSSYPRAQALAMWVPILPEHVWGDFDAKEMRQFSNDPGEVGPLVGTGPFQVVEWDKGQSWTLEANEDYWGGAPNIDTLVFEVFKNEEAMVQALRTGAVDYIFSMSGGLFNQIQGEQNIGTHAAETSASFDELGFNLGAQKANGDPIGDGHPAVQDLDFRLAIAHAINKQELVDRVLLGYGTPGEAAIPPAAQLYHWQPSEDERQAFDPELSRQILADAGYTDQDGDGFVDMPDGEPIDLRFFVRNESPDTVRAGEFITEWLKDVGINNHVQAISDNKLATVILDGEYDLFIWGWGVEPDPDFQLSTFTKGQFGNWSDSWYYNPEYDELYQVQKEQVDLEERAETVKQMQQILYEDVVYVVLWYSQELQAWRSDRWTGFKPSPEPSGYYLYGYNNYNYLNLRPVGAGGGAQGGGETADGGVSAGVWLALIALVIGIAVAVVLIRRRSAREEQV
jgi:peptide/nickel transport system substrate-binding protein